MGRALSLILQNILSPHIEGEDGAAMCTRNIVQWSVRVGDEEKKNKTEKYHAYIFCCFLRLNRPLLQTCYHRTINRLAVSLNG